MNRDQRIRDPVHDLIKFSSLNPDDALLWDLIQTPPMQRLRRIKQLGFTEFVYPGAGHTRLSHSIGAMQMARRMLDVLERNRIFQSNPGHKKSRCATLCAALLHDIGHGPFSHVFEDVSRAVGITRHHVEYTKEILRKEPISGLLNSGHVLDETLSFFETETGNSPYSAVISSQLDADRLDFLVRDRYYTGIRFGQIDLEWLFDSLKIQQISIDTNALVKQYSFVVDAKGPSVIEDYLLAYTNMYNNVYFHKTTRAVQFMVQDILQSLFKDRSLSAKLHAGNVLKAYFDCAPTPPLSGYLLLDDAAVVDTIRDVASGDFGELSELAQRYFDRRLYKCLELPRPPKISVSRPKLALFMKKLDKSGIFFHRDIVPVKGYKQYEVMGDQFLKNILVFSVYENDYRPIAHISKVIAEDLSENPVRFYFRSESDRSKARSIWKKVKNL